MRFRGTLGCENTSARPGAGAPLPKILGTMGLDHPPESLMAEQEKDWSGTENSDLPSSCIYAPLIATEGQGCQKVKDAKTPSNVEQTFSEMDSIWTITNMPRVPSFHTAYQFVYLIG